jgi:hypothetical protein
MNKVKLSRSRVTGNCQARFCRRAAVVRWSLSLTPRLSLVNPPATALNPPHA